MEEHFTKDKRKFVIRRAVETDAEALIQYSKALFVSTDQLLTLPEEYSKTFEEQRSWIDASLGHKTNIIIVAEIQDQIVGLLFFAMQGKKKVSHVGEFGVSVKSDFRGLGIGKKLVECLLKWAKDNSYIEKVILQVFSSNASAVSLYKALGFTEEGRHLKAVQQSKGNYVDVLQMYCWTK